MKILREITKFVVVVAFALGLSILIGAYAALLGKAFSLGWHMIW